MYLVIVGYNMSHMKCHMKCRSTSEVRYFLENAKEYPKNHKEKVIST